MGYVTALYQGQLGFKAVFIFSVKNRSALHDTLNSAHFLVALLILYFQTYIQGKTFCFFDQGIYGVLESTQTIIIIFMKIM